jgi:hypothetical protein
MIGVFSRKARLVEGMNIICRCWIWQALTTRTMKSAIFWDVRPCSLSAVYWLFFYENPVKSCQTTRLHIPEDSAFLCSTSSVSRWMFSGCNHFHQCVLYIWPLFFNIHLLFWKTERLLIISPWCLSVYPSACFPNCLLFFSGLLVLPFRNAIISFLKFLLF